jgi:[ribosomal protein S18]-alanine N-acetyltransferase
VIRELTVIDEAALAAFFEENNRPEVTAHFHPFPLDAETAHRICVAPRRDRYFAAWDYDAIGGVAMLRGWDEGYAVPSFGILVGHRHRGRGTGRALTEYALALAREMKAPKVRLTVHADNARAIRLYERTGFQASETLADGRLVMFAHGL